VAVHPDAVAMPREQVNDPRGILFYFILFYFILFYFYFGLISQKINAFIHRVGVWFDTRAAAESAQGEGIPMLTERQLELVVALVRCCL
jgi:hypothetical protein